MTYVISNIHGNYDKFQTLLQNIRFKDTDVLYILGDIVDYGDKSMELIGDISMRYNVLPIIGEREYKAQKLLMELDRVFSGESAEPEVMAEVADWISLMMLAVSLIGPANRRE